jgi:hypothetical protein
VASSGGGGKLGIAAVAVVMLVAGSHGKHHGHGVVAELLSSASSVIPSGGSYTPQSFARAVLRAEGDPRTPCNMGAMLAWEAAEGGHWNNTATYNPLNTTLPEPGSSPMNPVGVQSYTSWGQGLRATVDTLNNGNYPGILAALSAGDDAQAVADAVGASPWGTGYFTAGC